MRQVLQGPAALPSGASRQTTLWEGAEGSSADRQPSLQLRVRGEKKPVGFWNSQAQELIFADLTLHSFSFVFKHPKYRKCSQVLFIYKLI